jgi:hypothetical protein
MQWWGSITQQFQNIAAAAVKDVAAKAMQDAPPAAKKQPAPKKAAAKKTAPKPAAAKKPSASRSKNQTPS